MKLLSVAGLGIVFAVAGCHGKTPHRPRRRPPPVIVTPVVQRDVPVYQEWIGTTEGNVNAEIRPKVEGYLLRRVYNEGQLRPARATSLFEIDPRQFQAAARAGAGRPGAGRGAARQGRAGRRRASGRWPRRRRSASRSSTTPLSRGAARAKAAVDAARAAVDQARLNLAWTRVTSPIDGIAGVARRRSATSSAPDGAHHGLAVRSDPRALSAQRAGVPAPPGAAPAASATAPRRRPRADPRRRLVFPHKGHAALRGPRGRRQDRHHRHRRPSSRIPATSCAPASTPRCAPSTEVKKAGDPGPAARGQRAAGRVPGRRRGRRQQGRDPRRSSLGARVGSCG